MYAVLGTLFSSSLMIPTSSAMALKLRTPGVRLRETGRNVLRIENLRLLVQRNGHQIGNGVDRKSVIHQVRPNTIVVLLCIRLQPYKYLHKISVIVLHEINIAIVQLHSQLLLQEEATLSNNLHSYGCGFTPVTPNVTTRDISGRMHTRPFSKGV